MPVIYKKFITRDYIRSHREILFVFGDNSAKKGFGGQAAQMRGEPNSIGITTKKAPSNISSAFFSDSDYNDWKVENIKPFYLLKEHLRKNGTVCIPSDGIGTNRADLKRKSPLIWEHLNNFLNTLKQTYGELE